uniref:Core Histone H2A/H2B/H3 domain-containing protein n=1 Tax=Suricata suricatta TaxID=37032 RepID=A0A673VMA3_SURSU
MARSTNKMNKCSRGHPSPISRKKSHSSTNFGHRNYSRYVSRVLKEVVPQKGISSHTLDVMNTLINDSFDRISMEACSVCSDFWKRSCPQICPLLNSTCQPN